MFSYFYHTNQLNVSKYAIYGSYGIGFVSRLTPQIPKTQIMNSLKVPSLKLTASSPLKIIGRALFQESSYIKTSKFRGKTRC